MLETLTTVGFAMFVIGPETTAGGGGIQVLGIRTNATCQENTPEMGAGNDNNRHLRLHGFYRLSSLAGKGLARSEILLVKGPTRAWHRKKKTPPPGED